MENEIQRENGYKERRGRIRRNEKNGRIQKANAKGQKISWNENNRKRKRENERTRGRNKVVRTVTTMNERRGKYEERREEKKVNERRKWQEEVKAIKEWRKNK